jgi:hypothetical protein
MYLQADKPFFLFLLSTLSLRRSPSRGARGGARRPHKKEEKEVTEASGSSLSVFSPSFL